MFVKLFLIVLFSIYSIFLVKLFNFEKRLDKSYIVIFVLGSFSFASVFIVQVPIQKLIGRSAFFYNLPDLLKAVMYASVAGFVQEFFKALAAFYRKEDSTYGAVAGAGFGFTEAVFLLLSAPYISFTTIIERAFAVMFHISSTEVVIFGRLKGQFIVYYIAMSIVHSLVDTVAMLFQLHYVNLIFTEVSAAIIAFLVLIFAVFTYRKRYFYVL